MRMPMRTTRRPKPKRAKRWAVVDIEAPKWSQFALGVMIDDQGEVSHFDTLDGYCRGVADFDGRVFAHNGGNYDFLFLNQLQDVSLSGPRAVRARHGKAHLSDSFPLFPMSLKALGQAVGVLKQELAYEDLEPLLATPEGREKVFAYCEQDCRVLRAGILSHQRFCEQVPHPEPRWPGTAGSTAVYCAEAWEPEAVAELKRHTLDLHSYDSHRSAVIGGRCEAWQLGPVEGPIYCYDVKSSYPARYFEGPMPVGPYVRTSHERVGQQGVYWCRFTQDPSRIPLLSAEGVFCHSGEGWLTSEEMAAAREEGFRLEVLHGFVSLVSIPFGMRFATELYRLKEAGEPFAKVCLNALHGKLGEQLIHDTYRTTKGDHRSFWRNSELALPAWHQRPLMEAFILARARIALWRQMDALHRAGHRVLYTDTDSIHTTADESAFRRCGGVLGKSPGQWEVKAVATRAIYLARKAYALETPDAKDKSGAPLPHQFALKGFPSLLHSWELFERAWERSFSGDSPHVVDCSAGILSFRQGVPGSPEAKTLHRTLSAQVGPAKRRLTGDRVWYTH